MRIFTFSLLLILFTTTVQLYAQVEVPNGGEGRIVTKDRLTYSLNQNYKINWVATKLYGEDILQKKLVPSSGIKDIPQQISQLWLGIEKQVQYWSIEFDSLYVVTGTAQVSADTANVKNFFYKAILKGCQGDAIAFLVDETANDSKIQDYTIAVDSLEKVTKLDFFPTLDVDLQDIIESTFDPKFWPITNMEN